MEHELDAPRPATPGGGDHGSHLIQLIVNQDETAQAWLRFFFTIESALAAAFLFVITSGERIPSAPRWFAPAMCLLIPLFGIGITRALMRIVLRQNQWQIWFIRRFNALPGHADKVFPASIGRDGPVEVQPDGHVSRIMRNLGRWISLAWIVVALLVGYAFFWPDVKALLTAYGVHVG
jgi:uncharacterized membrane protein YhdT